MINLTGFRDTKQGGGYGKIGGRHPSLGTTVGAPRPMADMYGTDYTVDVDDEEDEELDSYVDDLLDKVAKKIASRTDSRAVAKRDMGRRVDRAKFVGNNAILEKSVHTTTARQGISPFPQKKFTGPGIGTGGASQAFKTTGNYKRTGTKYGTSRPHINLTDINDDNVFNLSDIMDPMERSFIRHQNRIKKLLTMMEEYSL